MTTLLLAYRCLLSTHADRHGVDISVTVCLFVILCVFVRLQFSLPWIQLAASNFARWFIGALGRNCPILGNLAPHKPKIRTNRTPPGSTAQGVYPYSKRHATDALFVEYRAACGRRIGMCGYAAVPEDGHTC